MMPLLSGLGSIVGGVTVPVAMGVASVLYGRLFPEEPFNSESLKRLQDVAKILDDGDIVKRSKTGDVRITEQNIKDIKKDLNRVALAIELMGSDPEHFEDKFFIRRSDNTLLYKNGKLVPLVKEGSKETGIAKAIKRLRGTWEGQKNTTSLLF